MAGVRRRHSYVGTTDECMQLAVIFVDFHFVPNLLVVADVMKNR